MCIKEDIPGSSKQKLQMHNQLFKYFLAFVLFIRKFLIELGLQMAVNYNSKGVIYN